MCVEDEGKEDRHTPPSAHPHLSQKYNIIFHALAFRSRPHTATPIPTPRPQRLDPDLPANVSVCVFAVFGWLFIVVRWRERWMIRYTNSNIDSLASTTHLDLLFQSNEALRPFHHPKAKIHGHPGIRIRTRIPNSLIQDPRLRTPVLVLVGHPSTK